MKFNAQPLNGNACTPEWVLSELQAKSKEIRRIFTICSMNDGSVLILPSMMPPGDQLVMLRFGQVFVDEVLLGGGR